MWTRLRRSGELIFVSVFRSLTCLLYGELRIPVEQAACISADGEKWWLQ